MNKHKATRIYDTDIFGDIRLSYKYRGYTIRIGWDFWNTKWYYVSEPDIRSMKFGEIKEMIDKYLEGKVN